MARAKEKTPVALWRDHKRACGKCGQSGILESLCTEGVALHAAADAEREARPFVPLEGQEALF